MKSSADTNSGTDKHGLAKQHHYQAAKYLTQVPLRGQENVPTAKEAINKQTEVATQ